MIELYFLLYRIPKMMSRAARERGRNPVAWSLIAIVLWIGTEVVVLFAIGVIYAIVALLFGWGEDIPAGLRLIAYIIALLAALTSAWVLQKYLLGSPQKIMPPPPPPMFDQKA
jgi:hypothetical protein